MKVPISLLLYKIKQKNNAVISRISQDISVGHPIFPDKAEKNKEHIVVVSNTQIPHFVAHKSFPLIVYADVDETVLQKTPGNYIAYPKGYSVFQVFNELTELFEIFEKWYSELDDALKAAGHKNMYVGTVESLPTLHMIMEEIRPLSAKKVHLTPFMIVAGDHARNDMAGEEKDSWGSLLKAEGYEVECHIIGLGELEGIQNMFVQHVREAK